MLIKQSKTKNQNMNKRIILTIIVTISCIGFLNAQVDFIQVKSSDEMEEVWRLAANENLSVFVDVYASWCGPCKWMDANVFAAVEAGNYMNEGFVNVKMDGESPFGSVFARENGLQAYPSLFVFNSEKKLMNMLVGAKPWDQLKTSLQNTLEFYPVLQLYQSKYDSELLSADEYPAYIKALRKMNKEDAAAGVAGHYKTAMMEEGEWSARDFEVLAFLVEPGSDNWTVLTRDLGKLNTALGDDLEEFIEQAQGQAVLLSVEEHEFTIAEQFISILPELTKGTEIDAEEMETRTHVYYYHYSEDFDQLISYIDSSYAKVRKGDHAWLFQAAADAVFLDSRNQQMTEKGIEWFKTCLELNECYEYYYLLGLSQYFSYQVDESLVSFKKAGEFATSDEEKETIKGVITEIESK